MSFRRYLKKLRRLKKILLLGSGAVGKTSLVKVFKDKINLNEIDGNLAYHMTPFMELETIKASILVQEYSDDGVFQIWDLAGQHDSLPIHATRDIAETSLGSVDLVLLMFASDSIQSLIDIVHWITVVKNFYDKAPFDKEPDYILIKNKIDVESTIHQGLIDHILKNETKIISYFEISCLNGYGLDTLKKWLVNHLFIDK